MFKRLFLIIPLLLSGCAINNGAIESSESIKREAQIQVNGAEKIQVNFDKDIYYVNDVVSFNAIPEESIDITSVTVNYNTVSKGESGYSFVAQAKNIISFVTKPKTDHLKSIDVILLSGQSNMEGNTNSSGLITTENGFTNEEITSIKAGYEGIKINYISYYKGSPSNINRSNGFVKTRLGQGNPSGNVRFGPEIGIAETLHNNNYDNKVVLIKCAVGASCLAPEANEWMGEAPYYQQFTSLIDNSLTRLINDGYNPKIKAFCWMQGEADGGNSTYASKYATNLDTFVQQFRTRYKGYQDDNGFGFIDGYISTSSVWTYATQINQQKQNYANSHDRSVTIDTNAAGLSVGEPGGDKYHYNVYSEFKLGKLFGEEIIKFIK